MLRIALVLLLSVACRAREFTFVNNMGVPIWPASLGNTGKAPINEGGWEMAAGATLTLTVPDDWAGRFWARTGCNFDASGAGSCATGDCGKLQCAGAGGVPPATLVEMTLTGANGLDTYDVSNVDGFNVMASMTPTDQTGSEYSCMPAACQSDINQVCPDELKVEGDGGVVACKSACTAFDTDQYCCRGEFGVSKTCNSNSWEFNYPKIFKDACPLAYSYAYNDEQSTFTCKDTNYEIVFG